MMTWQYQYTMLHMTHAFSPRMTVAIPLQHEASERLTVLALNAIGAIADIVCYISSGLLLLSFHSPG